MNSASAADEDAQFNALAAEVENAHGQETAALALCLQPDVLTMPYRLRSLHDLSIYNCRGRKSDRTIIQVLK